MKFGVLLLGGTIVLTGCGAGATGDATKTPAPPTSPPATAQTGPTGSSTPTKPSGTTGTGRPVKTPRTVAVAGTPYDKGRAYLRLGKYTSAASQFQASINHHRHVADSYAGVGTADIQLGRYPAAYRAFKSAVEREPKNPGYLYYAAYSALYAQDYHGAVSYASRFIQLQSDNAQAYHLRFLAYGKLLDHKRQVADARMVVKLQPNSPNSYNDLGIALTNDNKFAPAIAAFSQAIKLQPGNLSYYTNRAMAENLDQKPSLVLSDLYRARALARDPLTKKGIDEAIANFKKTIKH